MKQKELNLMTNMEQNYPQITDSFSDMIKERLAEQIGSEKAGRICKTTKQQKKVFRTPYKWVAAAAVLLICGTTVAAASNPEIISYLSAKLNRGDSSISADELNSYLVNVEPEVKDNADIEGRIQNTLENGYREKDIKLPLDKPLWRIDSAWCDGVNLYFSATPGEAAQKMSDRYHINPSDHCTVNGKDYMLESYDAEHGEGDLSEGEKTGVYHFCVTVDDQDLTAPVDFTLKLYIQDIGENMVLCAGQAISFDINEVKSGIRTAKTAGEIFLADGVNKAEVLDLKLTPSILTATVKYTLYGKDAKQQAEALRGSDMYCPYYIEDSFGTRIRGCYSEEGQWKNDVVKEADGSYSITFEWQADGINADTKSLTFIPYSVTLDSDGKTNAGTELTWAKFTVEME